jgi:hypothetical protein
MCLLLANFCHFFWKVFAKCFCARFGPLRTRSYPRVPLRELRVVYTTAHTLRLAANRSISCIRSPNGTQCNATQLLYSSDEVAYPKVLTQVTGAQLGWLYTLWIYSSRFKLLLTTFSLLKINYGFGARGVQATFLFNKGNKSCKTLKCKWLNINNVL